MIAGFILGFVVAWVVVAVSMASKAQRGYVFYSDGRRVKWTHRQRLEQGLCSLKNWQKK